MFYKHVYGWLYHLPSKASTITLPHQNNLHHHNHHHLDQALSQFLAILVTFAFAIVGGVITGLIMHQVDNDDDAIIAMVIVLIYDGINMLSQWVSGLLMVQVEIIMLLLIMMTLMGTKSLMLMLMLMLKNTGWQTWPCRHWGTFQRWEEHRWDGGQVIINSHHHHHCNKCHRHDHHDHDYPHHHQHHHHHDHDDGHQGRGVAWRAGGFDGRYEELSKEGKHGILYFTKYPGNIICNAFLAKTLITVHLNDESCTYKWSYCHRRMEKRAWAFWPSEREAGYSSLVILIFRIFRYSGYFDI